MEVITKSAQETFELGEEVAAGLKGGEVLGLVGPLGAGKTVFVQGLAAGLGIKERVTSPSYVLIKEYEVGEGRSSKLKGKDLKKLYHVDFYRLEKADDEVEVLGLPEVWEDEGNVVVIEWAEKARKRLPKKVRWVEFRTRGEKERKIKFK